LPRKSGSDNDPQQVPEEARPRQIMTPVVTKHQRRDFSKNQGHSSPRPPQAELGGDGTLSPGKPLTPTKKHKELERMKSAT